MPLRSSGPQVAWCGLRTAPWEKAGRTSNPVVERSCKMVAVGSYEAGPLEAYAALDMQLWIFLAKLNQAPAMALGITHVQAIFVQGDVAQVLSGGGRY